mgnify:CR=1 FL=1
MTLKYMAEKGGKALILTMADRHTIHSVNFYREILILRETLKDECCVFKKMNNVGNFLSNICTYLKKYLKIILNKCHYEYSKVGYRTVNKLHVNP